MLTPGQAQAAGLRRPRAGVETGRLVVVASPALDAGRRARARLRAADSGAAPQNDIPLDSDEFASARHAQHRAAPRRRLGRGRRLDERHVRERRAARQAAPAGTRRRDPRRLDRPEVRAMRLDALAGSAPTDTGASGVATRTPTSSSRRSSRSPTGWAAPRPARSRRRSPPRCCARASSGGEAVVELIQEANRRVYEAAAERRGALRDGHDDHRGARRGRRRARSATSATRAPTASVTASSSS